MYINGQAQSTTYSDSNNYSNDDLIIGEIAIIYNPHGLISNFRMVKEQQFIHQTLQCTHHYCNNKHKTIVLQIKTSVTAADVSPNYR